MDELKFRINTEKCIHCGLCINDCPPKILEADPDLGIPRVIEGMGSRCMKCQHCLAICPAGALSILGNSPDEAEMNGHLPAPADLLNLIKCRRSFRSYKHSNVDAATMKKLRDMLNWVPTGVNDHRLHFVFIDDVEVMDRFRKRVNEKVIELIGSGAPEGKRFERYQSAILAGIDIIFRGAPHLVLAATPADAPCSEIDPVIALSYFELYAQSLGLGTVWCGLATWAFQALPEILQELHLPPGYLPGYTMLFGNTALKYQRGTLPEPCSVYTLK